MPYIVRQNLLGKRSKLGEDFPDHEYKYPDKMDLSPKKSFNLHQKLADKILDCALDSYLEMQKRFDSWNLIDRTLTTYIRVDDDEIDVQDVDDRKPVSIVYPYTYAIHETILGYLVAAFLEEPIFRYEGVSGEDTVGAIMMEKIIDLHCNKMKVGLNLHTMFADDLKYGFGVVAPTWKRVEGWETVSAGGMLAKMLGLPMKKERRRTTLFEGNALINVSPYDCLPDPNVSISEIQRGEYFGWVERTNYMELLSEEKYNEDMFNVRYLRHVQGRYTSIIDRDASAREDKVGGISRAFEHASTNPVDVIHLYANIIPAEWGVGSSQYPEKWYFQLAADSIVLMAKPLGLDHNMLPVGVSCSNFDGYSSTPVSRLETLYGMQHTLDWMFNSHVANVRKAVNDMLVVDPYLVNIRDVKSPKPGKIIRLRRPAWGRGVENAVMQLRVDDITKGHINDSMMIISGMQKVAGVDEPSMGSLRQGGPERLTGKEFQGTQQGTYTRLERMAKLIGLQSMTDIGTMFAANTKQFMSKNVYLKTAGRWQQTLEGEFGMKGAMKATPWDILINYDLKVRDGSIPGGNFSDVWSRMFDVLAKQPELQQQFDLVRIFKHIARNAGAKNVDQFVRVQPMQAEQIPQQVQQGNIVPMNAAMGGM